MTNEASHRSRAMAFVALRRGRHPEQLGRFTDEQWDRLADEAEVPEATLAEKAAAVDYLRELIERGEYHQ